MHGTVDHEQLTDKVRQFAASRLYEMIESMRPFVSECLDDPGGLPDMEPSRIMANTAVIKLQAALIKDLGSLYQVSKPPTPKPEDTEPMIPVTAAQEAVEQERARMEQLMHEAVQAAVVAAVEQEQARMEQLLAARERTSLQAARDRVAAAVARVR